MAQQYELDLRDYYRIFRKRKFTILLIFCLSMAISYHRLSSQKPVYQSSIKIKIGGGTLYSGGDTYLVGIGDVMQTQMTIIESRPVSERAAKNLGWLEGASDSREVDQIVQNFQRSIQVRRIGETSIILLTATTSNPETAPKIAQAVAEAFRSYDTEERGRHSRSVRIFVEDELKKAIKRLEDSEEKLKQFRENIDNTEQAGQMRSEIAALEMKLQDLLLRATPRHPMVERLQQQIALAKENLKGLPEEELTLSHLRQEAQENQTMVSQLKGKYNDARIHESENLSLVFILEKATPTRTSFPNDPKVGLTLGAITGLLLGFILAFFKEGLDTSIGAIEDVESFLGVTVLGAIPHMNVKAEKKSFFSLPRFSRKREKLSLLQSHLITHMDPRAPEAESYHTLRTAIYSVLPQKEKIAIAISSTGPREGKSLTCANLAVTSAQMGKKTLLIDADFRRPRVHEMFGLDRTPGLFEVLTKTIPYDQALRNVSDLLIGDMQWQETLKSPYLGYLNFMTVGHLATNPPEILNSQEMADLIRTLLEKFDFLIFDCPPVLPVTDTLILAPKLDGVILVYQSGRTARNALKRAKIQLETAQAKLLGVVFNDIRPIELESSTSYYYRYRKYYSDEEKGKTGREENGGEESSQRT